MSSYFPMTGFKATVCASTGDNRHNCAPTRWGQNCFQSILSKIYINDVTDTLQFDCTCQINADDLKLYIVASFADNILAIQDSLNTLCHLANLQ